MVATRVEVQPINLSEVLLLPQLSDELREYLANTPRLPNEWIQQAQSALTDNVDLAPQTLQQRASYQATKSQAEGLARSTQARLSDEQRNLYLLLRSKQDFPPGLSDPALMIEIFLLTNDYANAEKLVAQFPTTRIR